MVPFRPPASTGDRLPGFSPPANTQAGFNPEIRAESFQLPGIVEEGDDIEQVHVAVGKSVAKAVALLQWAFRWFEGREICILHVHQPSPTIPTLLGRLPASQANGQVVSAFRNEEREQTRKLLLNYLRICIRSKVKASVITTETEFVSKGIVDLINENGIKKLVMGAIPENCVKAKKSSVKATHAFKFAPSFCEIFFVNKGKLVWTREASSESPSFGQLISQQNPSPARLNSMSRSTEIQNSVEADENYYFSSSSSFSSAFGSDYNSPSEQGETSVSDSKFKEEEFYNRLIEAKREVEASRNDAIIEFLKRRKLEDEALEVMGKVKDLESAHVHEVKLRKEAEDELRTTIEQQERLLEKRENVNRELNMAMRNIALLDARVHEANRRREEVAGELKMIQTCLVNLRQEKQMILRQKMEANCWLERWKRRGQNWRVECVDVAIGDSSELAEFSFSDLQTATCGFSESFKIGQGGFGSVYKGEMLEKTVAIKKLNPHDMHGQSEFLQEVQRLGKLQHPHLASLIGVCPEACSLVYEYLPNGSLQNCLFKKNNPLPLDWKNRTRIISQIASVLLFFHSHSKPPEKLVHGNLKPENILLDSNFTAKISDFGISRLIFKQTLIRCPSFGRYTDPKAALPYTDPEFHRTGILTPKSDVYSFGLIVLQLLTGRGPAGLLVLVRKAVCCANLGSVLDSSAGDWPVFVARRLAELGLLCCEMNGRDRPEVTPALVRELERLQAVEERPVPEFFLCPILKEIMHDPQVAADGFTYEGEALRGWLENGRETSPMTNLKFSHLHLTPNRALRQAIRDWLCES